MGFSVPRGGNGDIVTCPVAQLQEQSYQEWVLRLPVRLHGWGFRSLAETCGPAFLGALETAIPYMAARDELCRFKEVEWGGDKCWGETADPSNRWRILIWSSWQE